jgi:ribonuclease PH
MDGWTQPTRGNQPRRLRSRRITEKRPAYSRLGWYEEPDGAASASARSPCILAGLSQPSVWPERGSLKGKPWDLDQLTVTAVTH